VCEAKPSNYILYKAGVNLEGWQVTNVVLKEPFCNLNINVEAFSPASRCTRRKEEGERRDKVGKGLA
jgi:hypothetical protein